MRRRISVASVSILFALTSFAHAQLFRTQNNNVGVRKADGHPHHQHDHGHHHHRHNHGSLSFSFGLPSYRSFSYSAGYPYGYSNNYYRYPDPHGTYYNPRSNQVEYYLPPVYYPAELAYGPQAMKQFMGVDRNFALGALLNPTDRDALVRPEKTELLLRTSNLETLRRAEKFITMGDRLFRDGKYHEALQQYKKASRTAPDLARSYFRQGHALNATNRPEFAATAFKRGLAVDPTQAESDFRLDDIYGGAELVKTAHLESLANTILARPDDADLLFSLGAFLHFNGEAKRAKKFFVRAFELSRKDHLRAFLPEAAAAPARVEGGDDT